jgi:uroporphyrin-3 C-methyltransferase
MDSKNTHEGIENMTDDPVDRLLQEKDPPSTGKPVAILALLVSLAAVSASAWLWWQTRLATPDDEPHQQAISSLQTTQQQMAESLSALESQVGALESPIGADEISRQGERIDLLESRLRDLQGQSSEDQATISGVVGSVRSMEQRLSATESGLISVAASNQNSSVELDIAEIDYLLRVANERLQLFGDLEAADLALQAADVQIDAMDDPIYLSVRQRIATARQALAAVPRLDRIQLSARLSQLQSEIPDLPFRGEEVLQVEPELAEDAGWWQSFKHTMASLVTVRRRVPEDQAMLSLEDKDYLRQGLWLQLESARLALMRSDANTYIGSLDRVGQTVEQFFEPTSPAVQALLFGTADLKGFNIAPALPDISAPWTQLRQLRDSRRLLQSAAPVEDEDSVE